MMSVAFIWQVVMVLLTGLYHWTASIITMYFMIMCDCVTCGLNIVIFLITTPLFRQRLRQLCCPVRPATAPPQPAKRTTPAAAATAAAAAAAAAATARIAAATTKPDEPCMKNDRPMPAQRISNPNAGKFRHQECTGSV